RRLIGRLLFNHILDPSSPFPGQNITGLETLHMSLVHRGPTSQCQIGECGNIKIDALILVVQQ
ncbi:MAG: hypothetical protein H3C47_12255, partial [Candidatus Cloacimonetes bacterium]|nr:hypothetical protein [Candidatus Cloacimonadota bacterium]